MGQFQEIDGLHVTVDQVVYAPELLSPPDQPYRLSTSSRFAMTRTDRDHQGAQVGGD